MRNTGLDSYWGAWGQSYYSINVNFNRIGWRILRWQKCLTKRVSIASATSTSAWAVIATRFTLSSSLHRWATAVFLLFTKCYMLKFQVHCLNCYCLYYCKETEFFTLLKLLKKKNLPKRSNWTLIMYAKASCIKFKPTKISTLYCVPFILHIKRFK